MKIKMNKKSLLYPLMTEKAVKMLDSENKLTFVVSMDSTKEEIKKAFSREFNVKVKSVNTHIMKNKKIAFIKLAPENKAIDIITKLGLM